MGQISLASTRPVPKIPDCRRAVGYRVRMDGLFERIDDDRADLPGLLAMSAPCGVCRDRLFSEPLGPDLFSIDRRPDRNPQPCQPIGDNWPPRAFIMRDGDLLVFNFLRI